MSAFVVDVNVAIVANDRSHDTSPQADAACVQACIQSLREVKKKKDNMIVIDTGDHILREYRNYLSLSGQPGVGDEFIDWLHDNQYTETTCERVAIHEHPDRVFEEFPDDPELTNFDRADRKYVAVAITSEISPKILNAVDSDWRDFGPELSMHGISVSELCPQCRKA